MGILAVAVSGSSVVTTHGVSIPWWDKVACASALAAATVLGDRRVVVTVARGLVRSGPMDALAAQGAAAAVILVAGATGLPLSTSSVVTSGVVRAGAERRRRHVRWRGVLLILGELSRNDFEGHVCNLVLRNQRELFTPSLGCAFSCAEHWRFCHSATR